MKTLALQQAINLHVLQTNCTVSLYDDLVLSFPPFIAPSYFFVFPLPSPATRSPYLPFDTQKIKISEINNNQKRFYRGQQGRIQDFKLGGVHLKELRRVERGANIFGVFRVKNHDFTQKKIIFFQFQGGGEGAGCAPFGSAPGQGYGV